MLGDAAFGDQSGPESLFFRCGGVLFWLGEAAGGGKNPICFACCSGPVGVETSQGQCALLAALSAPYLWLCSEVPLDGEREAELCWTLPTGLLCDLPGCCKSLQKNSYLPEALFATT